MEKEDITSGEPYDLIADQNLTGKMMPVTRAIRDPQDHLWVKTPEKQHTSERSQRRCEEGLYGLLAS